MCTIELFPFRGTGYQCIRRFGQQLYQLFVVLVSCLLAIEQSSSFGNKKKVFKILAIRTGLDTMAAIQIFSRTKIKVYTSSENVYNA